MYTSSMQVYVGPYQNTRNQVHSVPDHSGLSEGQLVAVHCEESSTEPAIGVCLEVQEESLMVSWMKGSYTTQWKPWKRKEGRKNVDWVDIVPKSSIILFDFAFTQTGHLRKTTIEHLQHAYSCIKQQTPIEQ